jgi:hypothetical protein
MIFKLIKRLFNLIAEGDAYRLKKYGPTETMESSYIKAQKYKNWYAANLVPKCVPMLSSKDLNAIKIFKSRFHYWDEWTGSRYERVENPEYGRKSCIKFYSVCRSCPVTGYYIEVKSINNECINDESD